MRSSLSQPVTLRRPVIALAIMAAFGLATTGPARAQVSVDVGVTAPAPGWLYDLGAVVSLFIEPPVYEPEPVAIAWAPPPMLVEVPPPQPDPYAVWTGGYWTWQGDWVWCAGRWMDPPRQEYVWVQPYYEHREDRVIFIPGYWSAPDAEFIAPAMDSSIPWAFVNVGVVIGPRPEGPVGIFVPPPPGSRPGLIVPAPIGTPPAVVVSAPPVLSVGMRVTGSVTIDSRHTVINDNRVTNYSVTNVRNVNNVTVQAPAGATASGRAFQAEVPHQTHLAAAMQAQVTARAPAPATRTAVAAYVPGHTVAALPAPQKVQGLPTVPSHGAATVSQAQRAEMSHAPVTPEESRQAHAVAPRAGGRDVDTEHIAAPAAGPQNNGSAQHAAAPQANQRAQQEQMQQRAAQEEQAQQAEQTRTQRVQPQQRTQQEQAAQQRAQQEQAQHAQQPAEQQRAQREQAQQRAQQQAEQKRAQQDRAEQHAQQQGQQRAQQQQVQRAEQQRAQQEAQQEHAQRVPQHAQPEQGQRAEQQRTQQERGERAHPRGEEASRPSNGHE